MSYDMEELQAAVDGACNELDRVRAERDKLKEEKKRLVEALKDFLANGITDIDPRIKWVEMQVSKRELEQYRALLSELSE